MDMIALKRASDGNPDQQIAVKRSLLADAYATIIALQGTNPAADDAGGVVQSPKLKGAMAVEKVGKTANTDFAD